MLPGKSCVWLVAIALLVPLLTMTGQPPAGPQQPKKQESKLQELLKERLAAAKKLDQQTQARLQNAQLRPEEAIEPTRLAHEAALDLCKTDAERIKVLNDFLTAATGNETIALAHAKAGQAREAALLLATVERLRVEIELTKAKAKAAGKAGPAPQPKKAEGPRVFRQPATIHAYETVQLYARVPGFLKTQTVEIGDRVKRGQVLAVLDVPELEAQLRQDRAFLEQARATVAAAKGRVKIVEAEQQAANSAVKQAEAAVKSAAAWVKFRGSQYARMQTLFKTRSIQENLLEESREQHSAAVETEKAAKLAVDTAKAQTVVIMAKVEQAKAELVGAEAGIRVAEAKVESAQVRLSFATISAPFDGVITQRNLVVGDLVLSSNSGVKIEPIVIVQRMDQMRVVTMIPDRDVPFVKIGDQADVEIDAFPGKKWSAKVARATFELDPKTACMRVELDLPNPDGRLLAGMYGVVSLRLGERK